LCLFGSLTKAIYDDDPVDVSITACYCSAFGHLFNHCLQGTHGHSIRELDRGEGAALHAHLFEEAIDWYEPLRKHVVWVFCNN
jgi:protein phosphatase 1 regulatory subunit 10